jgi:hypothetical protein
VTALALVQPITPAPLKLPGRFSMSRLKAAGECMRKMALDDEADTSGPEAGIGNVLHEIVATAGLWAKLQGVEHLTPGEVEQITRNVIRGSEEKVDALSEAGWREVHRLARRFARRHWFPMGVECEVPVTRELDGWTISARIDWRWIDERECWIEDKKSGGKRAATEPTFQLLTYAWETLGTHPWLEGFWTREDAIPYGESEWMWVDACDLTGPGSIEEFLSDELARIVKAYADPPLTVRAGDHCSHCPDPDGCWLPEWARPESTIRTEEHAIAAVDAAVVLRARAKRATAKARAFLDGQERTHIVSTEHGKEYGYSADGSKCAIREPRTEE